MVVDSASTELPRLVCVRLISAALENAGKAERRCVEKKLLLWNLWTCADVLLLKAPPPAVVIA